MLNTVQHISWDIIPVAATLGVWFCMQWPMEWFLLLIPVWVCLRVIFILLRAARIDPFGGVSNIKDEGQPSSKQKRPPQ